MTKRKITSVFLIAVILCGVCLIAAGCPAENEENKKYDVTMKIACKEVVNGRLTGPVLGEWIFTPNVKEMYIEREYDGRQYAYYLDKYNLPQHPSWSTVWFSVYGEGANVFYSSLWKEGQTSENRPKYVSDTGLYCFSVEASGTSNIWNQRFIYLYVTVK